MRRWGLAAACAVAVAACTGGSGSPAEDAGGTPAAETTTTAPTTTTTTEPPIAGYPLVVVHQGFAMFPDPIDPAAELGGFGAIVENPNPHAVAAGVSVTLRLLDAEGNELARDTSLLNGIQPLARMAVGRTLIEPIEEPASMQVEVDVAVFLTPAHDTGALTATAVQTAPFEGGGLRTTFTVESTWPTDEEGVDVTALYRSEDGRILAAERTSVARVPAGGSTEGAIRLLAPIPDLAITEVYVGRGFAAQSGG
jgi:hypothetical protein